jgi:tRNA modification GTPase
LAALSQAVSHLDLAQGLLRQAASPELLAEELRLAQKALAEISGEFLTEDLLGEIFGRFCIGK